MKSITRLLMFFLLVIAPIQVLAETSQNEIDLATYPGKVLFDLSNVKPGDSVTRNIVIKNNGSDDFQYLTSSKYLSGSDAIYDKLDLTVSDSNGTLYDGKLFEFNKLAPRLLKSNQNDKLIFHIGVPADLGNEFQGLETNFQFKFYVEGTLGGILPANGPKLPGTGSNMYNILLSGIVLILIGVSFQMFIKHKRNIKKQQ